MELKLQNYGAFNDIYLRVPDEEKPGEGWRMFGAKLKKFALDGVVMGG